MGQRNLCNLCGLEKTFDSVPKTKLSKTLENGYYELKPKLIRMIRGQYAVNETPSGQPMELDNLLV